MTPMPPLRSPVPVRTVVQVDYDEDFSWAVEEFDGRADDAYWEHFARQQFTWDRFYEWWVARRWLVPRDVRKR